MILAAYAVPHPPIIIPEIGKGEEKKIARTSAAYDAVMEEAASFHADTLVITSPHADAYMEYFAISPGTEAEGSFGQFGAPQVRINVSYDKALAAAISDRAERKGLAAGLLGTRHPELDHGTLLPLYFYQKHGDVNALKIVRIGLSGLSPEAHYTLGKTIAEAASALKRRVIFIASGDLSHKLREDGPYGYAPEGPLWDKACLAFLEKADFLSLLTMDPTFSKKAAECGLRSFWIMAGVLDGLAVSPTRHSYEGIFGVGYGVVGFSVTGVNPERQLAGVLQQRLAEKRKAQKQREDPYMTLARRSVETIVTTGHPLPLPDHLPEALTGTRHGVFVSLHLYGNLRGCIGTIAPTKENTALEIIANSISAALNDPRFPAVRKEELPDLVYSVDILGVPERIADESALDPKHYGIITESLDGTRRGLLLPNLDGVESVSQQVQIARQKGGISAAEPISLYRFTVTRHA
jgi:AmmeMemoRadiSam system protein A